MMKSKSDSWPHHNGNGNFPQRRDRHTTPLQRPGQIHHEILRDGAIVIYQFSNLRQNRKRVLGYALAIVDPLTHRRLNIWFYEAGEKHWLWTGFCTLTDAQTRGCLDRRDEWVPYKTGYGPALPHSSQSLAKAISDYRLSQTFVAEASGERQRAIWRVS